MQETSPDGREPQESIEREVAQEATAQETAVSDDQQVDNELLDLQGALDEAERKMAEYKDAMLRMQAEMDNLRKRLIKDLERSRRRALEDFMNDLLPVKDSLERGAETDQDTATVESLLEGKALISRMLGKAMADHGLELIDPAGAAFDPELHQAMSMIESPDHEPGTVIEVLQKGYRLHDRLVRPAMVVVSKAP